MDDGSGSPAAAIRFTEVDGASPEARAALDRYFAELVERFGVDVAAEGHDGPFVVALEGGVVVAGGGVRSLPGGAAEVKRMWVDPARRGAGLGRRLLERLEEVARRLGHDRMVLDTKRDLVEAVALYGRCGFTPIGRYNDNPHAELFFEKRLT